MRYSDLAPISDQVPAEIVQEVEAKNKLYNKEGCIYRSIKPKTEVKVAEDRS